MKMRLKLKTILASLALAAGLLMMPQVKTLADGMPHPEVEPNNFNYDANRLTPTERVYASLPKGDEDWYKVYFPVVSNTSDTYNFGLALRGVHKL